MSFEEDFETAVKEGVIAGAVCMASSVDGKLHYGKSFGTHSFGDSKPLALDAILPLASATKLLTAIAALQCVEAGLWGLDDDISSKLPELASYEILTGFDESGKPIFRQREKAITLRLLLTHSSGLALDSSPLLTRYRAHTGTQPMLTGSTVLKRYPGPLLCEPGSGFHYGPGPDYAGLLIERLTGLTLNEYYQQKICDPLGTTDILFLAAKVPDKASRLAGVSARDSATGKLNHMPSFPMLDVTTDCQGGGSAYASTPAYLSVLESILREDEKLLKKETAVLLFQPQLDEARRRGLATGVEMEVFVGNLLPEVGWDHGLGGAVSMSDSEGWRREGTLLWSGMFNTVWFIDRKAGLCLVFGIVIFPPMDAAAAELCLKFEKAMYAKLATGKGKGSV